MSVVNEAYIDEEGGVDKRSNTNNPVGTDESVEKSKGNDVKINVGIQGPYPG